MQRVFTFDRLFVELLKYREEHGNLNVSYRYVTDNGVPLGSVVESIRRGKRKLKDEERRKLDAIGFIWDIKVYKAIEEIMGILTENN